MAIAVIVVTFFWALALATLWHCRKHSRFAGEAIDWPSTTGQVVESRISRSVPGDGTDDIFYFSYSYEVGGTSHVGRRIGLFGLERRLPLEGMEQMQARYPAGAAVQVHYMPSNPSFGVLEPQNQEARHVDRNLAFLLLALGAFILWIAPRFS